MGARRRRAGFAWAARVRKGRPTRLQLPAKARERRQQARGKIAGAARISAWWRLLPNTADISLPHRLCGESSRPCVRQGVRSKETRNKGRGGFATTAHVPDWHKKENSPQRQ